MRYFTWREQKLRRLGLDPDNDEHWALPDYELGLYDNGADEEIGDYHPPPPSEDKFGQPFVALCDDCLDSPAVIGDDGWSHVCEVCERRRSRRGLNY